MGINLKNLINKDIDIEEFTAWLAIHIAAIADIKMDEEGKSKLSFLVSSNEYDFVIAIKRKKTQSENNVH